MQMCSLNLRATMTSSCQKIEDVQSIGIERPLNRGTQNHRITLANACAMALALNSRDKKRSLGSVEPLNKEMRMHKSPWEQHCSTVKALKKTKLKRYLGIARPPGAAMIPHNSTLVTCIVVAKA